jgi:hypothetical protein
MVTRMGANVVASDAWVPITVIVYLVLGAWLSYAGYFGLGS